MVLGLLYADTTMRRAELGRKRRSRNGCTPEAGANWTGDAR